MGRKIPGRKHRGVKDPEKQQQERLAKIKDKINAPPSNINDQELPKSLARIIELKDKVKNGLFNKKKKQHQEKTNNNIGQKKYLKNNNSVRNKTFGKPENPVHNMVQRPGESDRSFKHRINMMCSQAIQEAAFEEKYKIDIQRNQRGEVEKIVKRPQDELEILAKKALKEEKLKKKGIKIKKKKKENLENTPKLTKSQKWARKKAEKKNKKLNLEQAEKVEIKRENFKFGDIVHAPPSLVVPKKAKKLEGESQIAPRPGKKDLLLKSMLQKPNPNSQASSKKFDNKNNKPKKLGITINKKGKRKELPASVRGQLDKQQKEVIDAYKLLKAKKYGSSS